MSLAKYYIVLLVLFIGTGLAGQTPYEPVIITIDEGEGKPGDVVCVEIHVDNFIDIGTMGMVISFNPSVVMPVISAGDETKSCFFAIDPNLFTDVLFADASADRGIVRVLWDSEPSITLDDGCVLFEVCFELIGEVGDHSDILLTEVYPTVLEFTHDKLDFSQVAVLDQTIGGIDIIGCELTCLETSCKPSIGNTDGSITIKAVSGMPPYSYNFNGTDSGTSGENEEVIFDNLGAGTYTYTITDAAGNMCNGSINMFESSDYPFFLELSSIPATCFDKNNGTVQIDQIVGGIPDYEIEWSNGEYNVMDINRVFPGIYTVTVTDLFGCERTGIQNIELDILEVFVEVIQPPSCNGASDGVVKLTATGGVPGQGGTYTFDIHDDVDTVFYGESEDGVMMAVFSGIPNGIFLATVSDSARISCFSDEVIFTFDEGPNFDLDIIFDNDPCSGDSTQVRFIPSISGNFFVRLLTDENNQTIPTGKLNGINLTDNKLGPGKYTLKIENIVGCFLDTMFIIPDGDPLILDVVEVEPGCSGADGSITVNPSGGTTPYTYMWNIDSNGGASRTGLGGGEYKITVTDNAGCTDSLSVTFIDGDSIPIAAFIIQAVSCGDGDDGIVGAEVTGSTSFTFNWSDGTMDLGTGSMLSNLSTGTYYVTATDGSGCEATDSVFLANPVSLLDLTVTQTGPTCIDANDGSLSPIVNSGSSPFAFVWKDPATLDTLLNGQVFTGTVGDYLLCITDVFGCVFDTLLTMEEPPNIITVDVTGTNEVSCFETCDGTATINASGGVNPLGSFVYSVNENIAGNSNDPILVTDLCAGENWVIAFDASCPSDTVFFTIPNQSPVLIDIANSTIVSPICQGESTGNIIVEIIGVDINNSTLTWPEQGVTGPSLTNIPAGTYPLEIAYGNGCVVLDTIELIDPEELVVEINPFATSGISCNNGNSGRITLNVFGGNFAPYTYDWTPNVSNTEVAEQLGPGTYNIVVTDSGGCSKELNYTLDSAPPISATIPMVAEPECFGQQTCLIVTEASGGVGNNFTFTINNGPRIMIDTCVDLFAGTYLVTVFDSVGCSFDTTITIDQPEELTLAVGPDQVINIGQSSEPISAQPVSFLPIDSFVWSPISTLDFQTMDNQIAIATPSTSTTYTVTVTDQNGCTASDDVTIEVEFRRNVYRPNIFSPNGDGVNDNFQLITGIGVQQVLSFYIYDRWGNKIHSEENYMPNDVTHPGWNGRYKNVDLNPGVYVYFANVVFIDGARVTYSGDVTLVR